MQRPALDNLLARLELLLLAPTQPNHRLYWLYLLTFVLLAAWVWSREGRRGGFLRFLLPRSVYLHRSTLTDLKVFVANSLVSPATTVLAWFGAGWVAIRVASMGDLLLGRPAEPLAWSPAVTVAATIALLVVRDFAHFLNHLLQHKVPLLWPLHAVHHSAEVLTPLTLFRKHPLYDVVKKGIEAPLVGLFQGVVLFLFGGAWTIWELAGVNALYAVFLLAGSNLRHSHIWLDWGPVVDRLLVSPAMHQVHHSADPKHRDRNFGSVLSIWDVVLGTAYLPEGKEELRFGLGEELGQPHDGLWAAWWGPLQDLGRVVMGREPSVGRPQTSGRAPGPKADLNEI